MPTLIRAREAAITLNVSEVRVRQMARDGILPAGVVVKLGRSLRFNLEALEAWCKAGGQALPGGWRRRPAEKRTDQSAAAAGRSRP
jgi:excisionase family DNA binding protein